MGKRSLRREVDDVMSRVGWRSSVLMPGIVENLSNIADASPYSTDHVLTRWRLISLQTNDPLLAVGIVGKAAKRQRAQTENIALTNACVDLVLAHMARKG